jgi:hypothetical protein
MNKLVLIPLLVFGVACSSSSKSSTPSPRSDRNVLTLEEISRAGSQDAYSAVQALRPHWLSVRGPSSFRQQATVKVYLDGNLMGGPDNLRQISIHSISSMRHMDGLEATQRYGLDHGQGAILVFTREN